MLGTVEDVLAYFGAVKAPRAAVALAKLRATFRPA
jgi:hypothetical protein